MICILSYGFFINNQTYLDMLRVKNNSEFYETTEDSLSNYVVPHIYRNRGILKGRMLKYRILVLYIFCLKYEI